MSAHAEALPAARARRAPRAADREPELADRRRRCSGCSSSSAPRRCCSARSSRPTSSSGSSTRMRPTIWPPPPFEFPKFVAGINTAILVTSSFTMHWALQSIKRNNRRGLQAGLVLTILMGTAFLLTQMIEYAHVGFNTGDGAFASVFFGLTGLHGAHVFVGLTLLTIAAVRCVPRALLARASSRCRAAGDLLALRRRHVDRRLRDGLPDLARPRSVTAVAAGRWMRIRRRGPRRYGWTRHAQPALDREAACRFVLGAVAYSALLARCGSRRRHRLLVARTVVGRGCEWIAADRRLRGRLVVCPVVADGRRGATAEIVRVDWRRVLVADVTRGRGVDRAAHARPSSGAPATRAPTDAQRHGGRDAAATVHRAVRDAPCHEADAVVTAWTARATRRRRRSRSSPRAATYLRSSRSARVELALERTASRPSRS